MYRLKYLICCSALCMAGAVSEAAATAPEADAARQNAERALAIIDATWEKGAIDRYRNNPTPQDLAIADVIHTGEEAPSGPSDVWPYTAAIEAHNSLLEAFDAIAGLDPECRTFVENNRGRVETRLLQLIDNLDWYRGSCRLASYAVTEKEVRPFAVPRAAARNSADVSGILNVYDDQMWIARELIRAWRLTGRRDCLDLAVYLVDYCLEGWDCWRDAEGNEYGGITWGPGYNSKHACSNGPIIQPLAWLAEIYSDLELDDLLTDAEKAFKFYYRDSSDKVCVEKNMPRSKYYLDFAAKVYDWQRRNLLDNEKGIYRDMLGADNTVIVTGGYRRHVDTGNATGSYFSYNTGTMISGGAELYRLTGEESYLDDLDVSTKGSFSEFARSVRSKGTYEFRTDESALNGFNTWFNNVLIRSYADALPYCRNAYASEGLGYMRKNLDYAFENKEFNKGNLLPVNLLDGWKDEERTKPFHQFAFASEYGVMASVIAASAEEMAVEETGVTYANPDMGIYTVTGIYLGERDSVSDTLPSGLYITGGKKILVRR